jgi:hypothetical protein
LALDSDSMRRAIVFFGLFACRSHGEAHVAATVRGEVEEVPQQSNLAPLEQGDDVERPHAVERHAADADYTVNDDGLVHGAKLIVRGARTIGWFGKSSTGVAALVVGMRIDEAHPGLQEVLVRGDRSIPIRCDNGIATVGGPCAPLWLGASLVRAEITLDARQAAEHVVVRRDESPVFEVTSPHLGAAPAVRSLSAWGDRWVLETIDDLVYVDGVPWNDTVHVEHAFEWQLHDGKPLYFFVRNGKYGLHYDDHDIENTYDVIRHGGCCDNATYNPLIGRSAMRFYARRGAEDVVVTVRFRS